MSPPLPGKDGSHNGLLNKQQQKDAETNKKRHPTLKDKEESERRQKGCNDDEIKSHTCQGVTHKL